METNVMDHDEINVVVPAVIDLDSSASSPSPAIVEDDQTTPTEIAFDGLNKTDDTELDKNITTINGLSEDQNTEIERKQVLKDERAEQKKRNQQMEAESRSAKLKQFQHLLSTSKFYTDYLTKRIAEQKMDKKLLEKESKHPKEKGEIKQVENKEFRIRSRRERQVKRKSMQLCDYMDDDEIRETLEASSPTKEKIQAEESFWKNKNGDLVSNRQPSWFTGGILKNYQLDGYEWLRSLYQNGINGILADEMGLGKTLQSIALICHLIEENIPGPHLIIAPLSTLGNWVSEFTRFAPDIPIALYHGPMHNRPFLLKRIQNRVIARDKSVYPVVISNYETILKDAKQLLKIPWKFIIIDEGHRIKNFDCLLIRALKRFHSKNRLLLTGTPLQNNLSELWSLLNFILPEVFDKLQVFESLFDVNSMGSDASDEKIADEEQSNQIVSTLHEILSPFLLRRLKCDVELLLPPKKELIVYAPLTKIQQEYYKLSVDKTIIDHLNPIKFQPLGAKRKRKSRNPEGYLRKFADDDVDIEELIIERENFISKKPKVEIFNATCKNKISLQNILMLLRKCCNHPYLINIPLKENGEVRIDEELVQSSGKVLVLDAMLPKLKERGHKVLLFSQMTQLLEFLQDYCDLRDYKYSILDGSMRLDERKENIKQFNEDPEIFIFLLSTRAGGLGLNLTAADTVFIFDSDWNPQCDLQAVDRCHRIGQKSPVLIYRLVTANTVDQRIVERAANKRKLEKIVMHKDKFKGGNNVKRYFSKSEILELLKTRDHDRVVQTGTENCVFTDEELEALLDRSNMTASNSVTADKSKDHVFKVVDGDKQDEEFHVLTEKDS